eukprot:TRINITY_DN21267_c0_g1_i1.p1 TRINITY_DN21267_c0_g1~~TRINITY_DN21267_c0_g1_i1.p1  ORF type:complete len:162 (-),score=24.34 TRINITY_DN21267_c0_g1_i1:361-798(-)
MEDLEVRQSCIAGAGLGLFTLGSRKAGEHICIYTGTHLGLRDALRCKDKAYLMRLGPRCYVDAAGDGHADVMARYINDCRNPAGFNVTFDKQPGASPPHAVVVALRDIDAGEELFVDYGRWYWAALNPQRLSITELCRARGLLPQ